MQDRRCLLRFTFKETLFLMTTERGRRPKQSKAKATFKSHLEFKTKFNIYAASVFASAPLAKVYPSTSVCQSRYFLTLYLSLLVPVFLCFYPKNWSFTLLSIWNVLFGLILSWFCSHSTYLPNYLPTYLGTSFFSQWLRYLTSIFLSHSAYTFIYIHLPTYRYTKT